MTPVDQFSALADATRCRVIELLHERPMPVHELSAAFDISRPAISRHLRVLKDAQLVKEDKHGRENVYSLQRQKLKPMAQWLERVGPKLVAKPAAVKARVAEPPKAAELPKAVVKLARPKPATVKPVETRPPQMQLDLF